MSTQTDDVRILIVVGSLREASHSRRLAQLAATHGTEDISLTIFDGLREVEPFDEDLETTGHTPGADQFRAAIRAHDALFIVTPEYNATIPGQLKNALDWASRAEDAPFNRLSESALHSVPVAVASVSTGQFGAVWAREDLLKSLRTQGARVITEPQVSLGAARDAFDDAGDLVHTPTRERLAELVTTIATQVRALRTAVAASESTSEASATPS